MSNLELLREEIAARQIPALLVNDISSVGWLTGFSGTAGKVVVSPEKAVFITDSRYTVQAGTEVTNMPTTSFSSPTDGDTFVAETIKGLGLSEVAFEKPSITYAAFEKLSAKMDGINLVPVDDVFSKLRMKKTPSEIDKIKTACVFADRTFEFMLDRIQAGRTEKEVELDLEFYIRRHGHRLAFSPIVVSGVNSARPHGHASDKVLEEGDFVTMDFGANIEGYNSDLTRTVVVGTATPRHVEVYNQVLKAQLAAIDAIKPGVKANEPDALARQILDEIGLAKYFGHGLGHGLGKLVHDAGRMSGSSEDVFEEGQVWTVEPGVYIEGFGGVRIEDDVVIVPGGVELLTHAPKELIELPKR